MPQNCPGREEFLSRAKQWEEAEISQLYQGTEPFVLNKQCGLKADCLLAMMYQKEEIELELERSYLRDQMRRILDLVLREGKKK